MFGTAIAQSPVGRGAAGAHRNSRAIENLIIQSARTGRSPERRFHATRRRPLDDDVDSGALFAVEQHHGTGAVRHRRIRKPRLGRLALALIRIHGDFRNRVARLGAPARHEHIRKTRLHTAKQVLALRVRSDGSVHLVRPRSRLIDARHQDNHETRGGLAQFVQHSAGDRTGR